MTLRIVFSMSVLAAAVAGQEAIPPDPPKFEVVSIRPAVTNGAPAMREMNFTPVLPGGQYVDSHAYLLGMISFAYGVTNPSITLVGLPDWTTRRLYAVAAKPPAGFPTLPAGENREQVRLMLRSMLEDRFGLRLHDEIRQVQVGSLEVAKGGIKIKASDPPVFPEVEGPVSAAMGNISGRMIGKKSTMDGLTKALVIFLKQPVVDRTGLTGYYDFDIKWKEVSAEESPGFGAEGTSLLLSNLQEQLGLRLSRSLGPAKFWVVDHIEPPTEN
jgi:uncharacterized protein (TIGR03435 family)